MYSVLGVSSYPQYTDSAAAYDAWWIPIRPNTDAAMMAGMAHHIFSNNLQDQEFIDKFCMGMDAGTMPKWAPQSANGKENFKDYILGKYDGQPKTPEWASKICRCQPWRAKRRLVDPSSREATLFSRRALRQRENKVGLRTRRPVIGSQVRSSNELAKLLRSAW